MSWSVILELVTGNPMLTALIGGGGLLAVGWWRMNRAREKARDATRKADIAKVKAELTGHRVEKRAAEKERDAALKRADDLHIAADEATDVDDEEVKKREDIANKYPPAILLAIALSTGSMWAACKPEPQMSGFLAALEAAGDVGKDGAAMIRSYQVSRAALCVQIDLLTQETAALRESLAASEAVTRAAEQATEVWKRAYKAAAEKDCSALSRWGLCGGPGLSVRYDAAREGWEFDPTGTVLWGLRW